MIGRLVKGAVVGAAAYWAAKHTSLQPEWCMVIGLVPLTAALLGLWHRLAITLVTLFAVGVLVDHTLPWRDLVKPEWLEAGLSLEERGALAGDHFIELSRSLLLDKDAETAREADLTAKLSAVCDAKILSKGQCAEASRALKPRQATFDRSGEGPGSPPPTPKGILKQASTP